MEPDALVYLDGKFVPKSEAKISVFDHGLLYGDGVFEGIRAFGGSVFMLKEHVDRLYQSAGCLELGIPLAPEEMVEAVLQTLRKNRLSSAYIRLVVTRGVGDMSVNPATCRNSVVFIITEPVASAELPKDPRILSTVITSVRRDGVDATTHEIKSLNYLNSILAVLEANRAKVDYPIILDHRGFVSEGSTMNIFLVRKGKVFTPGASAGILHGITRERIMKLCRDLKYEVVEKDITPFELLTADEVFFSGTLVGVASVVQVNGKAVGSGKLGPVTREVYDEFREMVLRPEEGTPVFRAEKPRASAKRQRPT
jgi:branched-chain amino acid aminotransferase